MQAGVFWHQLACFYEVWRSTSLFFISVRTAVRCRLMHRNAPCPCTRHCTRCPIGAIQTKGDFSDVRRESRRHEVRRHMATGKSRPGQPSRRQSRSKFVMRPHCAGRSTSGPTSISKHFTLAFGRRAGKKDRAHSGQFRVAIRLAWNDDPRSYRPSARVFAEGDVPRNIKVVLILDVADGELLDESG